MIPNNKASKRKKQKNDRPEIENFSSSLLAHIIGKFIS